MALVMNSSTLDVTSEHSSMPPSPPIVNISADLVKSATDVGEGIYAAHASSYHSHMGAEGDENDHDHGFDDESSWEDGNWCFKIRAPA